MIIHVQYATQVRMAVGHNKESIEVKDPTTLAEFLQALGLSKSDAVRSLLFNEQGEWKPGVLIFVNNIAVNASHRTELNDGDTISLMTLVSGG